MVGQYKMLNICVISVLKIERQNGAKEIFEVIITQNF